MACYELPGSFFFFTQTSRSDPRYPAPAWATQIACTMDAHQRLGDCQDSQGQSMCRYSQGGTLGKY